MKNYYIYILIFIIPAFTQSCRSQDAIPILSKRLISDLSETPIYPNLIQEKEGLISWKGEYKYLDSIDIYAISYLSDGLNIKGVLVSPKKKR